jgi:hypothetical protein
LGRRGTTFGTYPEQPVLLRVGAVQSVEILLKASLGSAVQEASSLTKQPLFQGAVL